MKGKFIMLDGLDGSGKGVVVKALKEYLVKKGKKVFDLKEYWQDIHAIPDVEEANDYNIIISYEPTYSWVGKAIREEIIRESNRKYSGLTTAYAFALDREILYRKFLIPCLEKGKIVIQDRGVVTSIVYQPEQLEKISLKDIINIPGNRLALKYAPDLLILTKVDPLVVVERLKQRDKKDSAIFENLIFQRKIALRYESEWLKKLFEGQKTKIVYLDTNSPRTEEDTKNDAIKIYEEFISS